MVQTYCCGHGELLTRLCYCRLESLSFFQPFTQFFLQGRRTVYNRIKMLSKMDTLSMGKRACIYDNDFRAHILFSRLESLNFKPILVDTFFHLYKNELRLLAS